MLYAANDVAAAAGESILHNIPAVGGVLVKAQYEDGLSAEIRTTRPLKLAAFHGLGLRALKLEPIELNSCETRWYGETAKWAGAAYKAGLDGCAWMSRAYVLFDRKDDMIKASPNVPVRANLNGSELNWLIDFCAIIRIAVEV